MEKCSSEVRHVSSEDRLPRPAITGGAGQGEGWGKGVGRGDSSFRMWCLFRLLVASFWLAFTYSSRTCSCCLASGRSLGSCSCKYAVRVFTRKVAPFSTQDWHWEMVITEAGQQIISVTSLPTPSWAHCLVLFISASFVSSCVPEHVKLWIPLP